MVKIRTELNMKYGSNDLTLKVFCECGEQMNAFYHDSKTLASFVCYECKEEHKIKIRPVIELVGKS